MDNFKYERKPYDLGVQKLLKSWGMITVVLDHGNLYRMDELTDEERCEFYSKWNALDQQEFAYACAKEISNGLFKSEKYKEIEFNKMAFQIFSMSEDKFEDARENLKKLSEEEVGKYLELSEGVRK